MRKKVDIKDRSDETDSATHALTLSSDETVTSKEEVTSPIRTRRHRIKKGFLNLSNKSTTRHSKSVGRSTSTKPHDAPMQKRDIYFALDCEMVGVGPNGLDSALARVSIINWDNEIVLDTYVKVDEPVTDYRTFVSGIRPEHIESTSAMSLTEVQKAATDTLRGKILIGHGLVNDLKAIGIQHPWCDTRDTATYKPFMREVEINEEKKMLPRRLRDLTWEKLEKEIQVMGKPHSPVEDAIASMDLYKSVRSEWENHVMKQVNSVNKNEHRRVGDSNSMTTSSHQQVYPTHHKQQQVPPPSMYAQAYHRQMMANMAMTHGYIPQHDPRLNAPLFPQQGQMMKSSAFTSRDILHHQAPQRQQHATQPQRCPQFQWKQVYM